MTALHLAAGQPDDPIAALIEHLGQGRPSLLLRAWAKRSGFIDGTPGEVTIELVLDTTTGAVRIAYVKRKGGEDWLDHMNDNTNGRT